METLEAKQGFEAVFLFLEKYYTATQCEVLEVLLGGMQYLPDGNPLDQALWEDWLECLPSKTVTTLEAYVSLKRYIQNYYERIDYSDPEGLLINLQVLENGQPAKIDVWQDWVKCVHKVLTDKSITSYFYLS